MAGGVQVRQLARQHGDDSDFTAFRDRLGALGAVQVCWTCFIRLAKEGCRERLSKLLGSLVLIFPVWPRPPCPARCQTSTQGPGMQSLPDGVVGAV